jgi:hypothetical protein
VTQTRMHFPSINDLIPESFHNSVEKYALGLLQFLSQWNQLFQYETTERDHVILFFKNNHFEKRVPKEWQQVLREATTEELIHMVKYGYVNNAKWPDSLCQFISTAKSLYLRPKSVPYSTTIESISGSESELVGEMVRGMNRKKQYEVERLADLIAKYMNQYGCNTVLDVGSGKGYLSHVLAFKYGLNVLAVDQNEMVVKKSQIRSNNMEKILHKKLKYTAISSHLTTNTVDFEKILNCTKYMSDSNSICLIGLHTCGDLSPIMMNLFLSQKRVKLLINIGCCYHKITEKGDEHEDLSSLTFENKNITYGYPLSEFVKKNSSNGLVLTNGGKVIACAALEKWSTAEGAVNNFRRNSHRCALEAFLHHYQGSPDHIKHNTQPIIYNIGRVPDRYSTFTDYAAFSLQMLKSKTQIHNTSLMNMITEHEQNRGPNDVLCKKLDEFYKALGPRSDERVACLDAYWSIRAIIGPIIEALIIIDRYMFLKERTDIVDVIRIFEEEVSPRNLVLIAAKKH